MVWLPLIFCKVAVASGTGVGVVHAVLQWSKRSSLARPLDRDEGSTVVCTYTTASAAGTLLAVPLVAVDGAGFHAAAVGALVSGALLSPLYITVAAGRRNTVADYIPWVLSGTALATGLGVWGVHHFKPSHMVGLEQCILAIGLGSSSFFTFYYANRYGLAAAHAFGERGRREALGGVPLVYFQQVLGNVAATLLLENALTLGVEGYVVDWWLLTLVVAGGGVHVFSPLGLPPLMAGQCAVVAAIGTLVSHQHPLSATGWVITSWVYHASLLEWRETYKYESSG